MAGLPDLSQLGPQAYEALFGQGQAPQVPPPTDLQVPPELTVPPGPLAGLADTAQNVLAPMGKALVENAQGMPVPVQQPTPSQGAAQPAESPVIPRASEESAAMAEQAQLGHQDEALERERDAGLAENVAKAKAAGERERLAVERETELRKIAGEREKITNDQVDKIKRLSTEIRNTKIDPRAGWNDMPTWRKTTTAIGAFIGGMLVPTVGYNPAMKIIEAQMDRAMDAQKANLDIKQNALKSESSLLGMMREQFDDKIAAEDMTRAAQLTQVQAHLEKETAGIADERVLARAAQMHADLDKQIREFSLSALERENASKQRQFENDLASQASRQAWARVAEDRRHNKAQEGLARDQLNAATEAERAKADASAPQPGDVDPDRITGVRPIGRMDLDYARVPGTGNEKQKEEIRATAGGANRSLDIIASLRDLGFDRNLVPDEKKAVAKMYMAELIQMQQAGVKGIPSDKDMERVKTMVGGLEDPQKFLRVLDSEEYRQVFASVEKSTRSRSNSLLKPHGIELVPRAGRSDEQPEPKLPRVSAKGLAKEAAKGDTSLREKAPGVLTSGMVETFRESMDKAEDLPSMQQVRAVHNKRLGELQRQLKSASGAKRGEIEENLRHMQVMGRELDVRVKASERVFKAGIDDGGRLPDLIKQNLGRVKTDEQLDSMIEDYRQLRSQGVVR